MCTLTVLRGPWASPPPIPDLEWRLVFNRDERRSRLPARPPVTRDYGSMSAVHPIDGDAGGTWIAATSNRVVLALLNGPASDEAGHSGPFESRGSLIPLLMAACPASARDVPIAAIEAARFRAFHLVLADDREVVEVRSDGRRVTEVTRDDAPRIIRTSSSVDTRRVCAWRLRAFERLVPASACAAQDAFHRHRDADPGRGIQMSRPDACTVSITTVDLTRDRLTMTYQPLEPSGATAVATIRAHGLTPRQGF